MLFLRTTIFILIFFSVNVKLSAQWTVINTVSNSVIWNVKFADDSTIYAVGSKTLMKSSDGGNTWVDLVPNLNGISSDTNFYNLSFLNKDTGFVFINNSGNNLLGTYDGGLTWYNASNGLFPNGIMDMQFLSSSVGYSPIQLAFDSSLAKTIDGGNSWTKLNSPVNCWYPLAIHFFNEQIGLYGFSEIYKTTDGGQTWNITNLPSGWKSNNRISEYIFFNDSSGLALTEGWSLYKTTDGGDNWFEIMIPISSGSCCAYNMAFDQHQFGYITSFSLDNPFISNDAGSTWVVDASFPKYFTPTCVSTSEDHKVIIGTTVGKIVLKQNYPLFFNEVGKENSISVFPNQTNDILYYSTSSSIEEIEIANCLGRTIARIKPNGLNQIDLKNYGTGFYLISFKNREGSVQKKVMKM